MKPVIGVLTAWVWLGSAMGLLQAGGLASGDTLWVFKHDGTVHCGPPEGIAPDVMAQNLTVSGITVLTMQTGHDGREGVALCGQPTGQINLYQIPAAQLPQARRAGFQRWSGADPHRLPGKQQTKTP